MNKLIISELCYLKKALSYFLIIPLLAIPSHAAMSLFDGDNIKSIVKELKEKDVKFEFNFKITGYDAKGRPLGDIKGVFTPLPKVIFSADSLKSSGGDVHTDSSIEVYDDGKIKVDMHAEDSGSWTGDQFCVTYKFKNKKGSTLLTRSTGKIYINKGCSKTKHFTFYTTRSIVANICFVYTSLWWAWKNAPVDGMPVYFSK